MDGESVACGVVKIGGALDGECAYGRLDGLVLGGGERLAAAHILTIVGEVAEHHRLVGLEGHVEIATAAVVGLIEGNFDGEGAAVERVAVEGAVDLIVDVEVETLGHLEQQVGSLQSVDFVGDVGAETEDTRVDDGAGIGSQRPVGLAFLLDEQGGYTGIDGHCAENAPLGDAQADGQGEHKPGPVAYAQMHEVLKREVLTLGAGTAFCFCLFH